MGEYLLLYQPTWFRKEMKWQKLSFTCFLHCVRRYHFIVAYSK